MEPRDAMEKIAGRKDKFGTGLEFITSKRMHGRMRKE